MFWNNFVNLCASVGKAPNVVASEIGLKSSGTVTGWKKGALPRPSVLVKIAKYFNITVNELIGEQEKIPPVVSDEGNKKELLFEYINHMNQDQLDQAGAFLKWLLSNPEK